MFSQYVMCDTGFLTGMITESLQQQDQHKFVFNSVKHKHCNVKYNLFMIELIFIPTENNSF